MAVKKGLRNPLDEAQVRKAVVALQSFVAKQRAERPKQPLVEAAEPLSCIITRKVVPAKGSIKPIPIDIPHSLHGEEGDSEICLFVKDEDKQRIKEALAADPVKGLTKVMTVKKLRKHFSRFEDKRTLAGAYDMFLADDRVLPYLKAPLGTKFFVKKKQPMSVRVSRKNVSFSVRAALRRTAMHVSTGACSNVKVALLDMPVDHIVENIMVAMNNCSTHIPKNWGGIQSISVKTNDSIALPIFNALSPLSKLPPVGKTEALTKRKLEEVEAEVDAESVEEPAKKKAKKHKKEAETKTEVKAEEPSNKKAKKAEKKVAEPAAEEKNVQKHKKEAEPVVEEKKSKKAKKAAEPAKEETPKKAKKAKKEAEPVAEEKKAKKQKVKHDEPAATEEAPKKAKKAKKDAPVEADKQKKKRKAGKN